MSPEGWELQRVLLVWLSMLALVPFDLFTIDTTADTEAERQRLEVRLVAVCTRYLCAPGAVRDAAAVVLGRLLTRPDLQSNLQVHTPRISLRMNRARAFSGPIRRGPRMGYSSRSTRRVCETVRGLIRQPPSSPVGHSANPTARTSTVLAAQMTKVACGR